jgi:hypothetical protein
MRTPAGLLQPGKQQRLTEAQSTVQDCRLCSTCEPLGGVAARPLRSRIPHGLRQRRRRQGRRHGHEAGGGVGGGGGAAPAAGSEVRLL